MKEQHRPEDIDKVLRRLPGHDPDEQLWPRIEHALREEQRRSVPQRDEGLLQRIAQVFRVPAFTLLLYTVIILGGAGMSWYLLGEYTQRQQPDTQTAEHRQDMLMDAQSDIEQAIFFYERAIGKLSVLAEESEASLDPQFVSLQKEKIALLNQSIRECKTALKKNGAHPEVQHYLLAAYTDLQHTLQAMVTRAQ